MRNGDLPSAERKIFTFHKRVLSNGLVSREGCNADSITPNNAYLYSINVFMRQLYFGPYCSAKKTRTSTFPSFATIFIAPIKCGK